MKKVKFNPRKFIFFSIIHALLAITTYFAFAKGNEGTQNIIYGFLWMWIIFIALLKYGLNVKKNDKLISALRLFYFENGYGFPPVYYFIVNSIVIGIFFYNEWWVSSILYIWSVFSLLVLSEQYVKNSKL
ncbi:hypothetical protein KY334_06785 [Candidatus Woesearchaeota archaeon]|nr:hypothetical protein [Candidatus Woesearchaeota archaeon]